MVGTPSPRHIDRAALQRFIEDHGIVCTLYKAMICPCIDKKLGSASKSCSMCAGTGTYYYETSEHRMLFSSFAFDKAMDYSGMIDTVQINCTFNYDVFVSDGDRVIPTGEIVVHHELLERGELRPGGASDERLLYRYPTELIKIVDEDGNAYTPDTDVELTTDPAGYSRQINWITTGPSSGKQYSVRYKTLGEYEVFLSQPRARQEHDNRQAGFCRLVRVSNLRG